MDSIWNNTFYYTQPALGWIFKVNFDFYVENIFPLSTKTRMQNMFNMIDGTPIAKDEIDQQERIAKKLASAACDINIGKREAESTDVFYGGVKFKIITRAVNDGDLTIKFNENKNYDITQILNDIFSRQAMRQEYPTSNSDLISYGLQPNTPDNIIRVIIYDANRLEAKDESNIVKEIWFYGCQLYNIDEVQLSYDSTEAITLNAHFLYNYMIIKNHENNSDSSQKS